MTGCGPVLCTTGTVYISTPFDSYWHWIYVDGVYKGETDYMGNLVITLPIGYHNICAEVEYWPYYYGCTGVNVTCGANYVNIYTY